MATTLKITDSSIFDIGFEWPQGADTDEALEENERCQPNRILIKGKAS